MQSLPNRNLHIPGSRITIFAPEFLSNCDLNIIPDIIQFQRFSLLNLPENLNHYFFHNCDALYKAVCHIVSRLNKHAISGADLGAVCKVEGQGFLRRKTHAILGAFTIVVFVFFFNQIN